LLLIWVICNSRFEIFKDGVDIDNGFKGCFYFTFYDLIILKLKNRTEKNGDKII